MIRELAGCLDRTLTAMRQMVADLSDEDLVRQPHGVCNHAAWTLGHVIYSCQAIAGELGVQPWLPDDWERCFGQGSSPDTVLTSPYARKATLLAAFSDAGDRLRAALEGLDENRLGDPLPDERVREILPTVGDALVQVVAAHTAFHAGQLAAWRRAIGRAPAGIFV